MIYSFRLFILHLLAIPFILSCSDDNPEPRNIVDNGSVINFEQIILLFNLQLEDSSYVYSSNIDSIRIFVNNELWSIAKSNDINISNFSLDTSNNYLIGDSKIDYLMIANQNIQKGSFSTVGDYADYLNQISLLKPGEYICLIESFRVKMANGETNKVYPYEYKYFNLEPQLSSLYLGEINITLK